VGIWKEAGHFHGPERGVQDFTVVPYPNSVIHRISQSALKGQHDFEKAELPPSLSVE